MKIGSEYYWYDNDHLGTPQKLTTSSGAVVWSAKYSSFGKANIDSGSTVVNPLRFSGQYYDSETGLHYNYHRYYDPSLGRYLRADPIGLEGGINPYLYTNSNPVNYIDPLGLWGFALDGGFSYGIGDGGPNSEYGSAGSGIYIGGRNPSDPNTRGDYAEIGAFSYQGYGRTDGAHAGPGINFTHYKIDASNFFSGRLSFRGFTWAFVSYQEYFDANGNLVGWSFSLFGKGFGLSESEGCVEGWSAALQ
jgi:RHS repeat-associated protein